MIPLYKGDGRIPVKNPIYFFRKSLGKNPTTMGSVIVLNSENSVEDSPNYDTLLPAAYSYRPTEPANAWYDIEVSADQPMWDNPVEPNADRDGSLAGQPRMVQRVLTLRGFVRGSNLVTLTQGINFLNYSFDPVVNYLEGASTFADTVEPHSQPFNDVGFGVLAWFASDEAYTTETHYGLINRFMYVRSLAHPVQVGTKFDDFNAAFRIELLATDPRVYECITPTSFAQVVSSSNGVSLAAEVGGTPIVTSTETIETPSVMWDNTNMSSGGPGYREETSVIDTTQGLRYSLLDVNGTFYRHYGDSAPTSPGPLKSDNVTKWLTDIGGGFFRTPPNASPTSAKRAWWGYYTGGSGDILFTFRTPVGGGQVQISGSVRHPSVVTGGMVGNRSLNLVFTTATGGSNADISVEVLVIVAVGATDTFDTTIAIPSNATHMALFSSTDGGADHTLDISSLEMRTADPGAGAPQEHSYILIDNEDASYSSWPVIWFELTANMGAIGSGADRPQILRVDSPNWGRRIYLSAPVVLSPAPTALAPVKIMIDTFNRSMYVDPDSGHAQAGELLHYLAQDSRFFDLLPRKIQWIEFANFEDDMNIGIRWRRAYV